MCAPPLQYIIILSYLRYIFNGYIKVVRMDYQEIGCTIGETGRIRREILIATQRKTAYNLRKRLRRGGFC